MKKILLTGLIAACAMSFTSCNDDTDPKIKVPTKFVLNEPYMAFQTIVLTPESSVNLEVSQADYGVAVEANYTVQIALDETFLNPVDLNGTYTIAKFSVPGESFAIGLCSLLGYTEEEDFKADAVPVWVRVISSIPGWEPGTIASNPVLLTSVQPYYAVIKPAPLYLIGQPSGWNINSTSMILYEPDNEIGSNIYYGTFQINEGEFQFRFYTQLGDWDANSIGAQVEDSPVNIELVNGQYTGEAVKGKGSWQYPAWKGGLLKISVNLNTMQVVFDDVTE